MFKKLLPDFGIFVKKALLWVDPSWWLLVSLLIFILFAVHLFPLVLPDDNHHLKDRFFLYVRRFCILALGAVGAIFPLMLYIGYGTMSRQPKAEAAATFKAWYWDMFCSYWPLPLVAFIGGIAANFCWHRYGEPYISNLGRKIRVTQQEDKLSDIREEIVGLQAKQFDPEKYFRDGYYFVGLDEAEQPIYIPADLFESTHTAAFGPTGFGKGVELGVIATQAIRRGNTVILCDPKDDDNIPYIMQNEAARAGRPFVYLDLNPDGKGHWHPFKGGTMRDRRSRIISAFKLERAGTNADVYKSKERGLVDKILANSDGSVRELLEALVAITGEDDLSDLRDSLTEWSKISTFMPPKKKEGHSIEKSLLNNAVVYVRGSISDEVVRLALRCYIAEVAQEAKRLAGARTSHLTLIGDEVRFVVSTQLVDALATIRSSKTNMVLATQSYGDLQNIQDQTVNTRALQQSFEINCQIKLLYRAGDADTAEWGEILSGTTQARIASMERTEVNRWGAEKWTNQRTFTRQEEPLISRNKFLALPPRVAVIYRPDALATTVFTCWVNVDKSYCSWQKKPAPALENSSATEPETTSI